MSMFLNPGCKGAIIEPTYALMRDFMRDKFIPAFKPYIIGESKRDNTLFLRNGISVLYLSGHDLRKLEQYELAWLLGDEAGLMKGDLFVRANARVNDPKAGHQRVGFVGTPKMGWLSDTFEGRDDSQRRIIHAKTTDNLANTPEFIEGLYASCPRRLQDAYINGKFVPTGGVVYAEYDPTTHIIPWKHTDMVRLANGDVAKPVLNLAVDFSPRRPHVLWIQRVPKGAIMPGGWVTKREVSIVVDEVYPDGQFRAVTIKRLSRGIRKRPRQDKMGPWVFSEIVCDPAGKKREATSGESEIIQLQKYLDVPVLFLHGERIRIGVQHVQLALDPMEGHPFLFFSDYLLHNPDPTMGTGDPDENASRSVLKSLEGYAYEEGKHGKMPDEPYHDDMFSHSMDTVRYHVRFYYPEDRLSIEAWSAA